MKSIEILTNRLANLRDSYDHYTMVDKDKAKAFWIKNDIEEVEILLNELNELKHLKDIEKELGINILELLQVFKKQQDQFGKITKDVDVDYLAHTVLNGITYRKLSEELGCPLEAMIKALKDGFKAFDYYDNSVCSHAGGDLSYCDRKGFYFDWKTASDSSKKVYLKDYQKKWWLKGEKENV